MEIYLAKELATITRKDGLTDDEGAVMDALVEAMRRYRQLPRRHPSELAEFAGVIHLAQDLLTLRIAQRHYPEGWTHAAG